MTGSLGAKSLSSRGRSLVMLMVINVLPGLNRCLNELEVTEAQDFMVARIIAAVINHTGRMSGLQVGVDGELSP